MNLTPDLDLVDFLSQPLAPVEQVQRLQNAQCLHADGLSQLLNHATSLIRTAPSHARQLTLACIHGAESIGVHALIPRANYIQAQACAMQGELNLALELIQTAHDGYLQIGEPLAALRTHLGQVNVLNELGRHQEALQTGLETLVLLEAQRTNPEVPLLIAHLHLNLGVCYRLIGRYEEALQTYEIAEQAYQQFGLSERLGDIYNNRGLILLNLGRVSDALQAFQDTAETRRQANHTFLQAQALINMGSAHLQLGNFTQSLTALDEARDLLQALEALSQQNILLLYRAQVYLALNLYPEAIKAYREAEEAFAGANMLPYRARSLWGLGSALMAVHQWDEAQQVLAEAANLFQTADNDPLWGSVCLEQAALYAQQGKRELALQTAVAVLDLVADKNRPVEALYAHLRLADLQIDNPLEAEAHLLAAQTLSDQLIVPQLRYRVYQRLGHLRLSEGRDSEAVAFLQTAVAEIERLRGTLAQESLRISFLGDKITAYEDLLQIYLAREDKPSQQLAFEFAEQAKSRTLVELLTGVINGRQILPVDPQIATQLQTLQADLNAIYNQFLVGSQEPEQWAEWKERAQTLEQAIRHIYLEAKMTTTNTDPFTAVLPFRIHQMPLPPLIAYHVVGQEVMAFVQVQGKLHIQRKLTTITAVQQHLQRLTIQWDRFRTGQNFAQQHMARLEQSAQRLLNELYQMLFAPLKPYLPTASLESPQPLAIIPHGALHQVPFHALYDGAQYLLEFYEISYAPSVTVFAICQQKPIKPLTQALVLAVSDLMIPAVRQEAETIAQQLPRTTLYLDDQATLAAYQQAVAQADILHIACHGLFRADNPIFSALKLHDGWLTAVDVLRFDLPGSLVTLSACESGRSHVFAGDELMGLPRAFLGAGASTLVVSLWLAQDDTTAVLMADWYHRLSQQNYQNRASALRAAQLALKERHTHPYYWAPFILMGQR